MEGLIRTLEERRDTILKRGSELAGVTRERGLDALGRVRSGALDWHETLNAWRSDLEARDDSRWGRLVDLQVRVLGRFDRALLNFGERVRAEIERLRHLELTASAQRIAAGSPVEAKPTKKPAAAPKAEAAKAHAAKSTSATKTAEAKTAEAKTAKAKTAKTRTARTKAAKTRPAAKATTKTAAKAKTAAATAGKTKTAATQDADAKAATTRADEPGSNGAQARRPSTRLVMPIADYDDLTAKEILAELPRITDAQCRTVLTHERAHKARKTVINALQSRVSS